MAKATIDVPVPLMQTLYKTLLRVEGMLDEGSDFYDEVSMLVSSLNLGLLDNECHPDIALINAGFYKHLLPNNNIF